MDKKIEDTLKKVIDPHTGINIVDMGLIKSVEMEKDKVKVKFVPTTPFCPMVHHLVSEIEEAVKSAGFKNIEVELGYE